MLKSKTFWLGVVAIVLVVVALLYVLAFFGVGGALHVPGYAAIQRWRARGATPPAGGGT